MFSNIPAELRALKQWVLADMTIDTETGKPKKHPLNPRNGHKAAVDDPSTWGTFEEAIQTGYKHIGFVLSQSDPFSIVDLDNKVENPASEEELQRHYKILNAFDSYTERSTSGRGYHIIVRGSIPSGINRDKVEVYSSGRYMICTGDVVRASPIKEYQELLTLLYGEMVPVEPQTLVDHDAVMSDTDLVEMACKAANANKFNQLCRGEWKEEYPSQSEADNALLSMLTFYSRDNSQVRRIFRMTALGKRDKATKNDVYLNRTLAKIRAVQTPEVDLSQLFANAQAIIGQKKIIAGGGPNGAEYVITLPPHGDPHADAQIQSAAPPQTSAAMASESPTANECSLPHLTLPPGIIGELATYFYQTAVRPVPEIALAAAIALVGGVVGRSYNISRTGLNQYIILLARTGSGKEGALSGIETLLAAVRPQIPMAEEFLGPAAFASGQALIKVLDTRPCFVSVLGEFGLTLQEISDNRANSAQKMFKKVLLDLYAKSGWDRVLRSSVYSDIEKNTKIIRAPSVTILGESTPETFYDNLDQSHIAEGLIPRFSIIEYTGPRPELNANAGFPPPEQLMRAFSSLVAVALTTTNNNTCCPVAIDSQAQTLLDKFEIHATAIINNTSHNVEVQLWNRAHLKALKLSALICVGINPHAPVVTLDAATWAIDFITREIESVVARFKDGDVGQGDNKQTHDMKRIAESFFKMTNKQLATYNISEETAVLLKAKGSIPYKYLAVRACALASFRNDRLGSTVAVKKITQFMVDSGMLMEIPKVQSVSAFKFHGICYGISSNW